MLMATKSSYWITRTILMNLVGVVGRRNLTGYHIHLNQGKLIQIY